MSRSKTAKELTEQARLHQKLGEYLATKALERGEEEKDEAYRKGRNRTILLFVCVMLFGGFIVRGMSDSPAVPESKQTLSDEVAFTSNQGSNNIKASFQGVEKLPENKQTNPFQKSFKYNVRLDEANKFFSITITSTWPETVQQVQFWVYQKKPVVIEMPLRVKEYGNEFDYEFRSRDINYTVGGKILLGLKHLSGEIEYIELPTSVSSNGELKAHLLR